MTQYSSTTGLPIIGHVTARTSFDKPLPKLVAVTPQPIFESNDPRCVVVIGGNYRCIPISYSLKLNAHGATNSATITLPISTNPDFSMMLAKGAAQGKAIPFSTLKGLPTSSLTGLSQPSQASQQATTIAIYAGFNANSAPGSTGITSLSKRYTGLIDSYSAAFHGDTVTFTCRSAASVLVDTKITRISENQSTTSFIAEQCARFGLQVNFGKGAAPSATIQQVLAFDQIGGSGFAAALAGMRIWDLMLRCALFDGVDLWETLGTVNYQSPLEVVRTHIPLRWLSNIGSFTGTHSLQMNKNIQVQVHGHLPHSRTSSTSRLVIDAFGNVTRTPAKTVSTTSDSVMGTNQTQSYNPTTGAVSDSTSAGGSFVGKSVGGANESNLQKYEFFVAQGPERCDLLAASFGRQISMHEYAVSLEVPMTKALLSSFSITSLLELSGSPYAYFNDEFWPREYTERFSLDEGFMLGGIEAVNHALAQDAV